MALAFGSKNNKKQSESSSSPSPSTSEKPTSAAAMGKDGYYGDFAPSQNAAENGGSKAAPRKMSRIDAPVTKPITGNTGVDDDSSTDNDVAIGKQMELEAGNAIKYRTCSWQKVRFLFALL